MTVRATRVAAVPDVLAVGFAGDRIALDGVTDELLPPDARSALLAWQDGGDLSAADAAAGSVRELPRPGSVPSRILLVGVGSGGGEDARAVGASITRAARGARVTVAIESLPVQALAEGLGIGGYRPRRTTGGTPSVDVITGEAAALERGVIVAAATIWARELGNTPADVKTPAWLARQASRVLGPLGVVVAERDEHWLAERGFGGVLAVGRGSAAPPRLIEAAWRGPGASRSPHVVVVGKGITFDTGGLNIKPGDAMRPMHTDMTGGAAALAAMRALATLRARLRLTVLVPAAQNSVSGSAMRPSDVIRHYDGRTSEVDNTDAEGRLVLADALGYAVAELKPDVIVDIATLTGAMKVALGLRTGGLFATDDALAGELIAAGASAGEPLWRMPLDGDYAGLLDSPVADAGNAPGNPGAITAALFLQPFVAGTAWAHLDIAGPARTAVDRGILTPGATGFGARLLTQWLLVRAGQAS